MDVKPHTSSRLRSALAEPKRLISDMEVILDVARSLGAERNLPRLLAGIVAAVTRLIGSDRTSCFLVDSEGRELWTSVAQGTGTTIRVPIGKGIAGTVAATGAAINIPSAYADPRFDPEHDRRSGYVTRSILCMPMRNHEGAIIGVIQTLNKRDGQPFTAYDEEVLDALCAQAAVAIGNAQFIARDQERQRLLRDMELARQIQQSLLPSCPEPIAGWAFAAFARTCDETGGDYYDFLPCRDGVDVVVGDVSGHGIAAALFMSTARASLRALHDAAGSGASAPDGGRLLARLNDLLLRDLGEDRFMTMVLCRLGGDGTAAYTSAGHDPPVVWTPGAGCRTGEGTGLILGMLDGQDYDAVDLGTIPAGSVVALFSDGIVEAQRTSDLAQFGRERLLAVIDRAASAAAPGARAEAVRHAIVAEVEGHIAPDAPLDDMTLVVAERLARAGAR